MFTGENHTMIKKILFEDFGSCVVTPPWGIYLVNVHQLVTLSLDLTLIRFLG